MTKLFYDHLIIIEEVTEVLVTHQLTQRECQEILELVDRAMHSEILNTIFKHLPKPHHEMFLVHLHAAPHDRKILEFIKEKSAVDIEKEILKTANAVKKKVIKEIESAKS
jgi:hypothetical protein